MKGIYIHIPFCVKKCNYCDFASFPNMDNVHGKYTDRLIEEMEKYEGTCVDSVYIGGGTPTVLKCEELEKLLNAVNRIFNICGAEFTVEVNPKTADIKKAELLKKYGVNRISIGAQSFNDDELKLLGRIHSSEDTLETYRIFRQCGFNNISLDLMYALPGQNIDKLSTSVDKVLKLSPEHISCYGLKYERGTPFYEMLRNGKIKETDEDMFADMYEFIRHRLLENGYEHYEISNFSKPAMESRHNLKYWNCDEYLGFGLSAASFSDGRRFCHSSVFNEYMTDFRLSEDNVISKEEAMNEFVILGLRVIKKGVDKAEFKKRFNEDFDIVYKCQTEKFKDFLINDKNSLKLRDNAYLISNSIMCEFMN